VEIFDNAGCNGNATAILISPLASMCSHDDNTREVCASAPPTGYFSFRVDMYANSCEQPNIQEAKYYATDICLSDGENSIKYGCTEDGSAELRAYMGSSCSGMSKLADVFQPSCVTTNGVSRQVTLCRSNDAPSIQHAKGGIALVAGLLLVTALWSV